MATKNKPTTTTLEVIRPVRSVVDDGKNKFRKCGIERDGEKIVLPEGMSYREARHWLQVQEDSEEKVVAISSSLEGFPLDGAVALQKAMELVYGFTALADTPSFFGSRPPTLVQVPTYNGELITATIGRMQPPMYEGGYIETFANGMSLGISGQIKKKFEPEVQRMILIAQEYLKTNSIYKGTSFVLDLSYITEERGFHPVTDAPKFMNVDDVNERGVILNRTVENALEAFVYGRVERSAEYEASGIPLKHTALFAGKFGTGKTLTSKIIASKAVRNGWTFIYLKTIEQFAACLKLAEMYAPAVVFTEDIDLVTKGERDNTMNQVLNTLDGADTKGKPIVTILTTNKAEEIEKAMLRAGRIDTLVMFDYPDAESAFKFVELYAKNDDNESLLAPMDDIEKSRIGTALAGKIPAFIAEAVHKAKCLAVCKHGRDVAGKVTGEDILWAADSQKPQLELLEGKTAKTPQEIVAEAVKIVGGALNPEVGETVEDMLKRVKRIESSTC